MTNKYDASNIISTVDFNKLAVGNLTSLKDQNSTTNYTWTPYPSTIPVVLDTTTNTNYLNFSTRSDKLYLSFTESIKTNNFFVEMDVQFSTKVNNTLFCFSGSNLNFYITLNNKATGFSIRRNTTASITFPYLFEPNTRYVIGVSKNYNTFTLYVNGKIIATKTDVTFNNTLTTGTQYYVVGSTYATSDDTYAFSGRIYSFNISFGPYTKYSTQYTTYGDQLVGRVNYNNLGSNSNVVLLGNITTTATISNNKVTVTSFNYNLKGKFTVFTGVTPRNASNESTLFNWSDTYKLNLKIIKFNNDPEVIVNEYTTAALNFENGIIDKVSTTIWNKEGTADVTSVNKIFGENSFETKALGDSLYTNNKVITGGSTPFTIEGYYLFRPNFNTTSTGTDLSLFSLCNDSGYYQGYFLSKSLMNIGTYRASQFSKPILDDSFINKRKIKVNEINKITISYDGSSLRSFINDELDGIYGTSVGLEKSSQPLRLMSYNFNTSKNTTSGLIDNINIHDGIATKVRDPDPYEEFLVVDLAFDGENNSTKIVDNGKNKCIWDKTGTNLLVNNKFRTGYSYLNKATNNAKIYTTDSRFSFVDDFTIEFEFMKSNDPKYCTFADFNLDTTLDPDLKSYRIYMHSSSYSYLNAVGGRLIFCHGTALTDFKTQLESKPTSTENVLVAKQLIDTNKAYKVSIVRKNEYVYLYINGVLDNFIKFTNLNIETTNNTEITLGGLSGLNGLNASNWFEGYINYFKMYEGVAVIPEDPTGKIQLDFDNNLVDKYSNSTWTNNGVTFDQVNSVKGYSAYFGNSSQKVYCDINNNLNFGNNNFLISLDMKQTELRQYATILCSNSSVTTDGAYIGAYSNGTFSTLTFGINGGIQTGTYGSLLLNNFYNINLLRKNGAVLSSINGVINGTLNVSSLINYNHNNGTQIGHGWSNTYSSNKYVGYIDNFKSYKEDLVNLNTTTYKGSGVNFLMNSNNDDLTITAETGSTTTYKQLTYVLKDSPIINNFILESSIFISKLGTGCSAEFSSNTSDYSYNNAQCFGYSFGIFGNYIYLNVGSNSSTANMIGVTKDISTYRDDNYHSFKAIIKSTGIDLFIDDNLILTSNENRYSAISSIIGINYTNYIDVGDISVRKSNTKYVKISDLNGNELYYKDWKSKIDNVIDKPAVHLPLETNATNVGFTSLTINSVGNPTYTIIDSKKCIKFESGKYLSIASNNIFNLGTSSDFYIEFDIYPLLSTNVSDSTQTILSNNNMWSSTFESTQRFAMYINQSTSSISFDLGARFSTGWLNIILLNKWNKITLSKEQNKVIFCGYEFYVNTDFNLSISNLFIGVAGWDASRYFVDGYMSNFKMFVGTSEIPETYNDKKVLDLDFKPTAKSYLFKDNNNKCIINPVNITQRDYQDSQYCCTFNGTNQYLQLGKNNLFNFGNDDFVINIKFKVSSLTQDFTALLSSLTQDSNSGRCGVCIIGSNYTTESIRNCIYLQYNDTSGNYKEVFSSNPILLNSINDLIISRINNTISIKLNEIQTNKEVDNSWNYNFNLGDNTSIGRYTTTLYFNGTIYSVKVLRNITDLTLLADDTNNLPTQVTYELTNGTDITTIDYTDVVQKDIVITKSDTTISAKIGTDILNVQAVDETLLSGNISMFTNYAGTVNPEIDIYNDVIESDSFNGITLVETDISDIVVEVTNDNEYQVEYIGEYTITGFIEGKENHEWRLINIENNMSYATGTGDYYFYGINPAYINTFKIIDETDNKEFKLTSTQYTRGQLIISLNANVCNDSDFCLKLFRRSINEHIFIGTYEIVNNICTINNLFVEARYDVMLFDRNTNIESRMMSDRTPIPY